MSHFVVQVTFELTVHTGPQPGDMAGLMPGPRRRVCALGLAVRERAACWTEVTYEGACAAWVAFDVFPEFDVSSVGCGPAYLWDMVYISAVDVSSPLQMPADEREFHLADTLRSCALVDRPLPDTVVELTQAIMHWAALGRTGAPATFLVLQQTAEKLRAVIVVHLDGGGHVVFSARSPLYAMHVRCSDRHYTFMSVAELSVLASSSAPHSGLLAGLGFDLAVKALSIVHHYMEDQRLQMYYNVYHRISMDVSDVKERWLDMADDLECLIAQQEEQLNYPHAITMGYVDNDLDEAIIRLGGDCRAMEWEAWSSEQIADSIHHDMFIQRVDAFCLCFAIGMPNPQGNKSDSAFFSAMGSCKHADCPCKRTRPGYRASLQWVPGVGTCR